MALSSNELRATFLSYFEQRKHRIVKSCSLMPPADPTLLFTNAGMVQFKSVFTGMEKRNYSRAASSQKCVRAGGKHNDLENVGFTARHHTFFEMLGNFSFGDYFKKEAIEFAWDFLTREINLPKERFYATVYQEDDEAFSLWREHIGLPSERVVRLGYESNFWAMGDVGPCGPCSELVYDQGEEFSCGKPDCGIGCECDRWLEIWNLVFMQFERSQNGKLSSLPRPSIDTGMGLERLAAVTQGVTSNYETDLLLPLIEHIAHIAKKRYHINPSDDTSMRVVADHARATAFLIADGILPSNEGRGYILRRIMRRAIRHGEKLGIKKVFMKDICPVVIELMSGTYPELAHSSKLILQVAEQEEERFRETLSTGLRLLTEEIEKLHASKRKVLSGKTAFKLYDTYGFPVDLTEVIARENALSVDNEGFNIEMEKQKRRGGFKGDVEKEEEEASYRDILIEKGETVFSGYFRTQARGRVVELVQDKNCVSEAAEGEEVEIVTDTTPFYAESGGQRGDSGRLEGEGGVLVELSDCKKPVPALHVHKGVVKRGTLRKGDNVRLVVDAPRRRAIKANHSATHILQFALREVLGSHIKQSGSLVAPERLRFDYSHFATPSAEQLKLVEELVNEKIQENATVEIIETTHEEALSRGAIAIFGEKYGERVRMVKMGGFSLELCGGTHVDRTGEIGFFKLISESSIAAGIRRVEALTGKEAIKYVQEMEEQICGAAQLLKGSPREIGEKISKLCEREKELEKELDSLRLKLSTSKGRDWLREAREVKGVKVLSVEVDFADPKVLRDTADMLRDKLKSGIVCLGAKSTNKAILLVGVTPDLTAKYDARKLIREIAPLVGGKGGGKPSLAQAGGPKTEGLSEALQKIYSLV